MVVFFPWEIRKDVPLEVNGSMVIGSMAYFTDPYKWGIPWGYNLLILTIDPNFQRDIQVYNSTKMRYIFQGIIFGMFVEFGGDTFPKTNNKFRKTYEN